MNPVKVIRGSGPIILGQPHSGTYVPDEIAANLNDIGRQLIDTDWHVPALYDGLLDDATIVRANFSRYVIDANRDPEGASLYPGQNTTALVPATTFDGVPIWASAPTEDDIAERIGKFHRPYHAALRGEIKRVKAEHGVAVLYDCHSIRSRIAHLFDGSLPDLNIGTNDGAACAGELSRAVEMQCADAGDYSYVVNGRFKGGWTTRHYGRPQNGVHAIQMELAQRTYLQSETLPFAFDETGAAKLRVLLRQVLSALLTATQAHLMTEKNRDQNIGQQARH